jgi:hypothetical protein
MFYVKGIADVGLNGGQVDQATVQQAANDITFRQAENGGALAVDTDIDSYTGATGAGAAGTVTYADGNANSIGEAINCINGIGVGSTAQRRYRAALGDLPPAFAIGAGFGLVVAQTNILLGLSSPGLAIIADTSGLTGGLGTDVMSVGIGTSGGTIAGSGWLWPDYFEDIPGSSTTASVNTPLRSSALSPRKSEGATTRRKQFRITGFAASAWYTVDMQFQVRDINNNLIWAEPLTAAAVTAFQDRSDNPIVGPVGSPLFACLTSAAGAEADGFFYVQAEQRLVP